MDALEPDIAPVVGTHVSGGLPKGRPTWLMELVPSRACRFDSRVSSVNPILDRENETAELEV